METKDECSRPRLRVVRAECTPARTTMPSVPPTGQLAQRGPDGEHLSLVSIPTRRTLFLTYTHTLPVLETEGSQPTSTATDGDDDALGVSTSFH